MDLDETKENIFSDNTPNKPNRTKFKDNPFLDENGKTFLPSLFTADEEKKFDISRDFSQKKYPGLKESITHIYNYDIADDYNYTITQLTDIDLYWLKFIGRFKSVQQVQLDRQTALFSEMLNRKQVRQSLQTLFRYGLIWKWKYNRDFLDHPATAYTLSVNGFRFLEYFYKAERTYFQPQNYFYLDDNYHIRFWETVDLYQIMSSLPIYKGFGTYFNLGRAENGPKKNLTSPLQEALEIIPNQVKNFVFFPALQTDNNNYYKDAIARWDRFTDSGKDLSKPILDLPGKQNILAFFAPTVSAAERLNTELSLPEFNFPILVLIGSVIQKDGITQAFYYPDHANKSPELQRMFLPNLVDEGDGQ